jgi:phenylpropionate dioxygenase-like ring-hydroxylating dioxygenase large terminal subunit
MMTKEENDLLTQTGPGTPCGELLRRYWQPVALAEELPPGGPPLPIKLLGEELVLFRDDQGRLGLLALRCSHRGTDLSYGRIEDGGLRCVYHGWLYDIYGRCVDQPGEPGGGKNRDAIRHPAYPCEEVGGVVFSYMGPGKPPLFPLREIFSVPDKYRFVYKAFSECNYLQGNEGNIDPVHLSFLHRILDEKLARGDRPRGSQNVVEKLLSENVVPTTEVEVEDFGLRIYTWRPLGDGKAYLRVSNFVMPNLSAVPGEAQGAGYLVNWHVPIDDTHHWKYMLVVSRERPLDKALLQKRYAAEIMSDYRPTRNRANRYLQDQEEIKSKTFAGLGSFFPVQDLYATESQGPVQDRTQEHLVSSDKAIVAARKLMLKAIKGVQEGQEAPRVIRDPKANRFPHWQVISEVVPSSIDMKDYVHQRIQDAEATHKESETKASGSME